MKTKAYYILFAFAAFLVQVALARVLSEKLFLVPQLSLLAVMFFALENPFPESLWFAFFSGSLNEFYSASFFGAYVFSFILVAGVVYFVTRHITSQKIVITTAIFLVALNSLVFGLWIYLYSHAADFFNLTMAVSLRDLYSLNIVWTVAINILFFYPLYFLFRLIPDDEKSFPA